MKTNYQILLRNFQAGTTTAILLIPQSMAYALVAGVPPVYGLYASLLPLVVYALLGRSRELALGPGALDTLLIGVTIGSLSVASNPSTTSINTVSINNRIMRQRWQPVLRCGCDRLNVII